MQRQLRQRRIPIDDLRRLDGRAPTLTKNSSPCLLPCMLTTWT